MSSKPDSRLRFVTDGSHLRKLVSVWLSTVPVLETCAAKASQEPAEDAGVCDSSIPHVATICTPQEFLARTYDLQEHLAEDKANTDGSRTAFLLDPSRSWIFWQLVHGANERTWVKCHSLLPPSSSHARGQKAQEGGDDIQAVWRWAGVSAEVNRDTKNRDLFCRAVAPDTIEDGKRVRTNVERVLETQEMQDEVKSAFVLATSSLFASGKKGSGTKEWFPLAEKMYKDLQQAAGRRTLLGKWVDCLTGNIAWEYGSQAEWVEHLTSRSFDNPFVENPEFDDCLKSLGTADDIHTWASEHPSIVFSVSSKPDQDRLRVLNVVGWGEHLGKCFAGKSSRSFRPHEDAPLEPLLETVVDGHCFSPETSVGGRCGLTVEGVRVLRNALDSLPDWDRMIGCPQRESSEAKLDSLSWVYGTEEDWKNWVKRRNLKARWAFPKAPNFETLVSDHGTQGGGVDPGSQTKRSPQYTWSRRQHDVIFIIRESGEQQGSGPPTRQIFDVPPKAWKRGKAWEYELHGGRYWERELYESR
ncbi:hypothetical protein DB88DRAFT_516886 [Papiliotrema laurentii]|uniref:Uncharacterized protein n=1 Tax=Papiliotrema laurentii TaxID=5418 RepID=A0AAD9FXD8_PAPLA|nr:hypothetical protein DB88DRAFT_516886 [Papiliotrema laurentii]